MLVWFCCGPAQAPTTAKYVEKENVDKEKPHGVEAASAKSDVSRKRKRSISLATKLLKQAAQNLKSKNSDVPEKPDVAEKPEASEVPDGDGAVGLAEPPPE